MHSLEYFTYRNSLMRHGVLSETEHALKSEGRNPDFELYTFNHPAEQPRDWAQTLAQFSENMALPAEKIAHTFTDASLDVLTGMRKIGFDGYLTPWEKWWLKQNPDNNLKSAHQRDIVIDWLADSIFPEDIFSGLEKLRPGMKKWHDKFKTVAADLIYAPGRVITSSMISALIDGASTVTLESMIGVGVAKALTAPVAGTLEAMSDQVQNRVYESYSALASDIRITLQNYDTGINADLTVSQILNASTSEISYRLSEIGIKTTWLGLSLGVCAAGFAKDGPLGLAVGAGTALSTGIGMLGLKKTVPDKILHEVTKRYSQIRKRIEHAVVQRERVSRISGEVYIDDELQKLYDERFELTKRKNIASESTGKMLPAWIGLTMYALRAGSLSGAFLLLTRSLSSISEFNNYLMTYRSNQHLRQGAIDNFRLVLAGLQGERGPLTDESLQSWLAFNSTPDLNRSLQLDFRSVGLPEYRNSSGSHVDRIKFEDGFCLKRGELAVVLGGNKSGKTTLLKTLAGIYTGDLKNTQIQMNGIDLRSVGTVARRHRFIYLDNRPGFNLKETASRILMNYSNSIADSKIDDNRVKNWVKGDNDIELQKLISAYIMADLQPILAQRRAHFEMKEEWFDDALPSGFESLLLKTALYLSIDEPVVLLMDQPTSEGTESNNSLFVEYINGKLARFPGCVVAAINYQLKPWLESESCVGFIDMKEPHLAGRMKRIHEEDVLLTEERLSELKMVYENGLPMNARDFLFWIKFGPKRDFVTNIQRKFIRKTLQTQVLSIQRSGLASWENGPYAKYLELQLPAWLDQAKSMDDVLDILYVLNTFYFEEGDRELEGVYLRRFTGEEIGGDWSRDIRNKLILRLKPMIELSVKILNSENEGNKEDLARAFRIENAVRKFTEKYVYSQYHLKNPDLSPHLFYKLASIFDYMRNVYELPVLEMINDPVVIDFIASTNSDSAWVNKLGRLIDSYIFSVQVVEDIENLRLKLQASGIDFRGTKRSIWSVLNSDGELEKKLDQKKLNLIAQSI